MIKIMSAKDLPLKTRKDIDIFDGFVEVTIDKNSTEIKPIEGKTYSEGLRNVIQKEGFVGLKI